MTIQTPSNETGGTEPKTPLYGPPYALAGRRITVVGWGQSGQSAARLALREGASVEVMDSRSEGLAPTPDGVLFHAGGIRSEPLVQSDLIVLSPGVPPELAPLQVAREAGVCIIGEVELAVSFLQASAIVGITGTNGKSTTTALCAALFEADGRSVFAGGNLGPPACDAVLMEDAPEIVVLELSSFQLQSIGHLHPKIAVILNLSEDHLDRHGDLEGYAQAKERIFMNQGEEDLLILNADDPRVRTLGGGCPATKLSFSLQANNALGSCLEEGRIVYRAPDGVVERYRLDNPSLRGPHNQANAAAAVLVARVLDLRPRSISLGLARFPGLPHRLESVRTHRGVEWVNDSKATNVDSAVTGLRSFSHGVILIAGGQGKGSPYGPLAAVGEGRLKAVLGVGEDGELICEQLRKAAHGQAETLVTLEAAVLRATELAVSGDTVLLSPACASYDQFPNYIVRGERFRTLVEAIA